MNQTLSTWRCTQSNDWYEDYCAEARACSLCSARAESNGPVPGEGPSNAKVVFIGRNPGREEDRGGRPFIGAAGRVLDAALEFIGLQRSSVFITNLCLCHTQGDRFLTKQEVTPCMKAFLIPSVKLIKPEIVVVFGKQANYFINGLKQMQGNNGLIFYHSGFGCHVMSMIHPASVCYTGEKRLIEVPFKGLQKYLINMGIMK